MMSKEREKDVSGIFVFCDTKEEYAELLFGMLSERLAGAYQFHLFHDIEKLKEYLRNSYAEVLLFSEEYEEKTIREVCAGQKIILTEDPGAKDICGYPSVFRYQSAGKIIEKINMILKKEQRKGKARIRDEPLKKKGSSAKGIIGVYSPVHRIGKTKFALKLGQKIARDIPVLYINMEGYSGGDHYFHGGIQKDLGDLLYCIRQERDDYGLRISTMTGQSGKLDYIMPMKNEQDMRAVRCEEWMNLLDIIQKKCIYEVIILDLGDAVDGLYDILKKCSRIYTLYINDETAQAKLKQDEDNLKASGYADVLGRTVKKQAGESSGRTEKVEVAQ